MKAATDSFTHHKHYFIMIKQSEAGPGIIARIGRVFTRLLYLEIGIYLVVGVVALVMYGVRWLVELFK